MLEGQNDTENTKQSRDGWIWRILKRITIIVVFENLFTWQFFKLIIVVFNNVLWSLGDIQQKSANKNLWIKNLLAEICHFTRNT